MRKALVALGSLLVGIAASGYEVSMDRQARESTGDVSVDVKLDTPAGLSYVSVQLAYDASVLSVKSVMPGSLSAVFGETFVSFVTNGIVSVSLFSESGENVASKQSGTVATILFGVRAGVDSVRTDVPIVDVQLGEKSGVVDVSVASPLTVSNLVASLVVTEVAVPEGWTPRQIAPAWTNDYPTFQEKFGADFVQALYRKTGKKNARGEDLLVWHDFVQGTDPTDEASRFTAAVEMVDGKPVITWNPALNDTATKKGVKTGKRTYRIFGRQTLGDGKWVEVKDGEEAGYHFFRVTVEMPDTGL